MQLTFLHSTGKKDNFNKGIQDENLTKAFAFIRTLVRLLLVGKTDSFGEYLVPKSQRDKKLAQLLELEVDDHQPRSKSFNNAIRIKSPFFACLK